MQVSLSIQGAKELDKKLKNLEPKLARRIIRQALRKAGKVILEHAKSIVPVKTGALKKSLKVRAGRRRKNYYSVHIGTGQIGSGKNESTFKGEQFYGAFVELGTEKTPAKPFLRPAFDAEKKNAERILANEIRRGLGIIAREK